MSWIKAATQPAMYEATSTTSGSAFSGMTYVTATSTVAFDRGGEFRLRTYGVHDWTLLAAAGGPTGSHGGSWNCGMTPPTGPCSTVTFDGCTWGNIGYLDSGAIDRSAFDCSVGYTTYNPDLVAVADDLRDGVGGFDPCGSGACGSRPVKATCIPLLICHCAEGDAAWDYESVGVWRPYPWAPDVLLVLYGASSAQFAVRYKNPSVVKLPDGQGWVMFLARLRELEGPLVSAEEGCENCTTASSQSIVPGYPGTCISDIVAFWSDNPGFDDRRGGSVRGPYLMVDSTDALPGLGIRLWLGVPGAEVVQAKNPQGDSSPYVYLYYQVERPYNVTTRANLSVDPGMTADDWDQAMTNYDDSGVGNKTFRPGIALKRFAVDELVAAFATGPMPQSGWTRTSAATGDLLGQVRIWLCDVNTYGLCPNVVSFEGVYRQTVGNKTVSPEPADPAPRLSHKGLNLFFSVICVEDGCAVAVQAGKGYGVWRGVAVAEDGGITLAGTDGSITTYVTPIFGIDILVCGVVDSATGLPKDQLVESIASNMKYLDPDPLREPFELPEDQSWRVYVGNDVGPLELILGDPADGNTSWREAWCGGAGPPEPPTNDHLARRVVQDLPWLRITLDPGDPGVTNMVFVPNQRERAATPCCADAAPTRTRCTCAG